MILYFSGTGNTRYAASLLAKQLNEESFLISKIKPENFEFSGDRLILMFPIYAWGVPPIMLDFISRMPQNVVEYIVNNKIPVLTVCTCGDETGNAIKILEKSLAERGLHLDGAWSVRMPNVYVLLPGFDVDSKEVEQKKLDETPAVIKNITEDIKSGSFKYDLLLGSSPKLKTAVVFPLFKKWGISPKKWHWTNECIQCGKCASVCPVGNIRMHGGHPKWGANCTSCLACYHICPVHAVAYGKITEHKGQYFCKRKG